MDKKVSEGQKARTTINNIGKSKATKCPKARVASEYSTKLAKK